MPLSSPVLLAYLLKSQFFSDQEIFRCNFTKKKKKKLHYVLSFLFEEISGYFGEFFMHKRPKLNMLLI